MENNYAKLFLSVSVFGDPSTVGFQEESNLC